MKTVIYFGLFLSLINFVSGCEKEFENYLRCLKEEYHERGYLNLKRLEAEYTLSLAGQTQQCSDSFCEIEFIPDPNAFRNNGDCVFCDAIGNFISDKIMIGSESARKCVNNNMVKITKRETEACLLKKAGVKFDYFPDFEEKYKLDITQLLKSTHGFITVRHQIDKCYERSKKIADQTAQCLQSFQNLRNFRPLHCKIANTCLSRTGGCRSKVKKIHSSLCECMKAGTASLMQRTKNVIEEVKQTASNATECITVVTEFLRTAETDWVTEMTYTLNKCPLPDKLDYDIPTLLEVGCSIAYSGWNDFSGLEKGIALLSNFFEALFSRYARFCPCDS